MRLLPTLFNEVRERDGRQAAPAFSADNREQAILSAIEILPGFPGRIRPIRILTGKTPYYSNDGRLVESRQLFEGGQAGGLYRAGEGNQRSRALRTKRWATSPMPSLSLPEGTQ